MQSSSLRRRSGGGARGIDDDNRPVLRQTSLMTRCVNSIFAFVRLAEFEFLFFLFVIVAFIIFKDLTSRPAYNNIFTKKPDDDFWSF